MLRVVDVGRSATDSVASPYKMFSNWHLLGKHWMADWRQARRALTWVLAIALVGSIVAIGAIAVNPPETTEPYTEFYLLGSAGNATDYPTELRTGESGIVIVGVSNHEHRSMTYTMQVTWNSSTTQTESYTVPDGKTVEKRISITAPEKSGRYRVRFELYRGGVGGEVYRYGRLWVTVRTADT